MKRIWITGIAGFIGFHLALFLKKRGDVVSGIDNFNSYYDPEWKRKRAEILRTHGIEVLEGESAVLDAFAPTHIAHLAAQAGVRFSLEQPQSYIDANMTGFLRILEWVRHRPGVPLIYASSSSVYGKNTKMPLAESDPVDAQASLYGVTKRCNELMASTYHHLFGIRTCGLRFFTVYGPWGRPDMAYWTFAKSIWEERPIQIFNHGQLERDFTYIDDIVNGVAAAIDLSPACEVINLGNHSPVKLLRFVEILEEAIGKKAIKEFLPMQPGDVHRTFACGKKSYELLGFTPKTSLEEGLEKFVYFAKGTIFPPMTAPMNRLSFET